MDSYSNNNLSVYYAYDNENSVQIANSPSEKEIIYSSPNELGVSKSVNGHEGKYALNGHDDKYAVRVIMEKYDSLRCLNGQMEGLQISSTESTHSLRDNSLDDGSCPTYRDEEDDQEGNHCGYSQEGELSEQDIIQVEVFFRSHKTYVFVCQCLANLYFTSVDAGKSPGEWELARTGIPVLLLDKGDTRARNKRMLQIVLAEKGSGFVLWRDVIDNLTDYRSQDTAFHTMYLSSDHRRMAGFSFDVVDAAEEFMRQIEQLTSDPLNISLSVPKQKKKKTSKSFKKEKKTKQPKKCDISQPCCFEHVTSVALDDKKKLFSMATLVSPGERKMSG